MVSGEPDGTRRIKAVVQYAPGELRTLTHGVSSESSQEDEGTENQSSEWSPDTGFEWELSDEDTIIDTGTYSLKIDWNAIETSPFPGWIATTRAIGTSFTWEDFVKLDIDIRTSDKSLMDILRIGFRSAGGDEVYITLTNDDFTNGAFSALTFTKSQFTTTSGVTGDTVFTLQAIWVNWTGVWSNFDVYYDGWDITTSTIVVFSVDASGNLQANVLDDKDTVIPPKREYPASHVLGYTGSVSRVSGSFVGVLTLTGAAGKTTYVTEMQVLDVSAAAGIEFLWLMSLEGVAFIRGRVPAGSDGHASFTTPYPVPAGEDLLIMIYQWSGGDKPFGATLRGFEIVD